VACPTGVSYRTASTNVQTEGQINQCIACTPCVDGITYESTACTPTVNRVCSPCSTACAAGSYRSWPCNTTADRVCTRCKTVCPAGKYKTLSATCSGSTTFDAFLAACKPCLTPEDCGAGKYVSRQCPGTDTTPNQCVLCSVIPPTGDCPSTQYRGGCVNYTNTRCMPFTQCPARVAYLAGESRSQDGVCRSCTNCSEIGLGVLRNCSTYDDAVCQGRPCNRSVPCVTPDALANRSRLFCDYSLGEARAFCGMCPSGYGSDGQFCAECPRGSTCNRLGQVECKGQCRAGFVSGCTADLSLGSVACEQACPIPAPGTGGRWVRRGTHIRPDEGKCETYFQCGAGYFKVFRSTGVVECEACPTSLLPSGGQLERWVTEGLSVGDNRSCLWECKREVAALNAARTGCAILPGRQSVTGRNPSGWWLDPLSKATGQCASGRTSEQDTAVSAAECVPCHALPAGAVWVGGSSQCDWNCIANAWAGTAAQKRGGACVAPLEICAGTRGYTRGAPGPCIPTSFPWNRGGYSKVGWADPVVRPVSEATWWGGRVSGILQDGLAGLSLRYGIGNRHTLAVDGRNNTVRSFAVPGPLCSGVRGWVGRYEYVFGAVCNQSFLVYLNLSGASSGNLAVLIGNSTPGWRDGFRTQALFESELYVASSSFSNGTLFVLDRWNCLLREVVIYGEPGGYLTRVYTVWGNTDKLALAVPEPRCYGDGGLASPRRFWNLRDGWVAFADDSGLWQFHTGTRDLVLMVRESDGLFEADDLLDVDTTDEYTLRLVFSGGSVWIVTAQEQACPQDYTSRPGGDCTVDCPWMSATQVPARWVNRTGGGGCLPCSQLECGYGEVFTPCTRDRDAQCSPCEPRGEVGVYTARGTCEDTAWRTGVPPCSAGSYAKDGGRYCERCPELTATWFPGATDVRQCKCVEGLVRRWDKCVAEYLFEVDPPCAAREACVVPDYARLVPGDLVGCKFECLTGFYHRVGAGWVDKCSPCLTEGNASSVPVTRGDDDEPWSCEWSLSG
jgi:TNFR/NGFR cysteine-rich region